MAQYVMKQLVKYGHATPAKPQHCLYLPNAIQYGKDNQTPTPSDDSPLLDKAGKKAHPTNCRQLPLLCTSSWSYNSDGIIWSLFTTVSTNWKHNEASKPIPWLYVDSPRCYHKILCIWHDPECSLWCLLPLRPKSTQPSRRLLFPRQPCGYVWLRARLWAMRMQRERAPMIG